MIQSPRIMVPSTLALGAAILCAPAAAQPAPPHLPGTVPSYKIEALRFQCLDETGFDWPFSDEIRVGITTAQEDIRSREFGSVDTHETKSFGPEESCILPVGPSSGRSLGGILVAPGSRWSCANRGVPGPFSFTVVMAEQDWYYGFETPEQVLGPNDDLIGRKTVFYGPEELLAAMPAVGDSVEEMITLSECDQQPACVVDTPFVPNPAVYTFTWRVTRMPDTFPPLEPSS